MIAKEKIDKETLRGIALRAIEKNKVVFDRLAEI
jgi:hypothetical protein